MGVGVPADGTCLACRVAVKEAVWRELQSLWAEGRSMPEIRAAFGWTHGHLSVEMTRMRAAGWDLPHRYKLGATA